MLQQGDEVSILAPIVTEILFLSSPELSGW